ncbi:MAG: hypothetical protein RSG77_27035, partial [Hafnia sp.]
MIERTLWCETENGRTKLPQGELRKRTEPLLILGEAGMGKSYLLEWFANAPGHAQTPMGYHHKSYHGHPPQT